MHTTADSGDRIDTSFSPCEHHTAVDFAAMVLFIAPTQKSAFTKNTNYFKGLECGIVVAILITVHGNELDPGK